MKHNETWRGPEQGPFGTNEGDTWWMPDSPLQRHADEQGDGLVIIHTMVKRDGVVQEAVASTYNPELIAEAKAGYERLIAEQARSN